tara:strand:- start:289 stop:417 length:129 start_codon:yes stop_codon:yes gene_type:complete
MSRKTKQMLMGAVIGAGIVLMNVGNMGLTLANLFGKNIEYGD